MDLSVENLMMGSTSFTLVLGILFVVLGASLRVDSVQFIKTYASGLENDLPEDVCVEEGTHVDFCSRGSGLNNVYLGEWLETLGSVVVITGFLIVTLSLLGFVAACRNFKALLFVMIGVVFGSLGLEVYLVDIITNQESGFHSDAQDQLLTLLEKDYKLVASERDTFTHALNVIMLQGECCGVMGKEDFGRNLTYNKDGFNYVFHYPPACCKRETLKIGKFNAFAMSGSCLEQSPSTMTEQDINEEGCYETLFNHISDVYGPTVYGVLLFLIIAHFLDILLAVRIIMRSPPTEELPHYSVRSSQAFSLPNGTQKFQEARKFLPFAKSGSLGDEEARGTRLSSGSTEIW